MANSTASPFVPAAVDGRWLRLAETHDSAVLTPSTADLELLRDLADDNRIELTELATGEYQLSTTGHAGVIALPDGPPIHIQPKVTGTALLQLLSYSTTSTMSTVDEAADIAAGTTFVDLLGMLFAEELTRVRRQGLASEYQRRQGTERHLRGQLALQRQLQQQGPAAPTFECDYETLTRDTPLNQAVLAAAQTLLRGAESPDLQQRLRGHVQALRRDVTLREVASHELDGIKLTRLTDHYDDILRLTRLVLANVFVEDLAPGEGRGYTLLLRMYDQFEAAVERAVTAAAGEYMVQTGYAAGFPDFLTGDFSVRPEPDAVIVDDAGTPQLVLDAKWKLLDGGGDWAPSTDDIYQMLAYQQHTDTPGVLVYPGEAAGIRGTAATAHDRELYVAELPVAGERPESFAAYCEAMDTALDDVVSTLIA
ncbi:McrC family protein [Halosegnis longus]|uniref:McrC family protein n=1 Tax=Halosegnis longus TaxID=2216012 RepID=UPI001562BFBD|nr:hypothetical protein [Halosegnis longus]